MAMVFILSQGSLLTKPLGLPPCNQRSPPCQGCKRKEKGVRKKLHPATHWTNACPDMLQWTKSWKKSGHWGSHLSSATNLTGSLETYQFNLSLPQKSSSSNLLTFVSPSSVVSIPSSPGFSVPEHFKYDSKWYQRNNKFSKTYAKYHIPMRWKSS